MLELSHCHYSLGSPAECYPGLTGICNFFFLADDDSQDVFGEADEVSVSRLTCATMVSLDGDYHPATS